MISGFFSLARQSHGFRAVAVLLIAAISLTAPLGYAQQNPVPPLASPEQTSQSAVDYHEEAHPYMEKPLDQLVELIPELKKIRPATDQSALPGILKRTGHNVDDYFSNLVDLVAHEKIAMQRSSGQGFSTPQRVEDNYLILREPYQGGFKIVEYRTDAAGHRPGNGWISYA
jgi:hypothetical protein